MAFEWKDVGRIAGAAAPLVGTLLGGPAGTALGGLLAAALGTENTPDAVHAAISADPGAALKLAEFESDNKIKLQALVFAHADKLIDAQVALEQADGADRKSAREASVAGSTAKSIFWLSVGLLVAAVGMEILVLFVGIAPTTPPMVTGRVLGLLDSVALMVLTYHYGTSSGSQRKTELLANSAPVLPTP